MTPRSLVRQLLASVSARAGSLAGLAPLLLFVLAAPSGSETTVVVDGLVPVHGPESADAADATAVPSPSGLDEPSRSAPRDPSPRTPRGGQGRYVAPGGARAPRAAACLGERGGLAALPAGFISDRALAPPATA